MKYTPIITNGMLSHWPMFSDMLSSKFTWISFRNSKKKRKVKMVVLKFVSSLVSCYFCPRLYSQTIPKKKMK